MCRSSDEPIQNIWEILTAISYFYVLEINHSINELWLGLNMLNETQKHEYLMLYIFMYTICYFNTIIMNK